jgi:hypothetical protein
VLAYTQQRVRAKPHSVVACDDNNSCDDHHPPGLAHGSLTQDQLQGRIVRGAPIPHMHTDDRALLPPRPRSAPLAGATPDTSRAHAACSKEPPAGS